MPPQSAAQPTAAAALAARAHSRKISAVQHSSHRYFSPADRASSSPTVISPEAFTFLTLDRLMSDALYDSTICFSRSILRNH